VSDGIRYYKPNQYATRDAGARYGRSRPPAAPPYDRPYVVPPPVERRALPEATGSRRPPAQPPEAEPRYARTGWARWIGRSWRGHRTATGEIFDPVRLTGAHASLPLPSFVYVTNKGNGRTVLIRVNDRAEAVRGRAIVVSQRAAELLDFRRQGRIEVVIQYAGPASPVPNERHEIAFLNRQSWYRRMPAAPPRTIARRLPAPARQRTARYPAPAYPRWDNTRR
jgi:rare lipoprotein A (peptidoglycan hydrolase)